MQWSTVEAIEVSSQSVQSGNQVDYERDLRGTIGTAFPGQSSEPTWDLDLSSPELVRPSSSLSSSDKPLIRKAIYKSRKTSRPELRRAATRVHKRRINTVQTQRPKAPHNTSQYILSEKGESPPASGPEEVFTTAPESPSASMIGVVSWVDLERAEQDLRQKTVGAPSGIVNAELDTQCTPAFNRLDRQEQRSHNGVVNAEDIVTVLLREIKYRDRLIEDLTASQPSSFTSSS